MTSAPKVFLSYSHDSADHKDWVLNLSTRLVANGVDVVLDQWDLTLGGDMPSFMEKCGPDVQRVIAICTARYTEKANAGRGGVGYEKMILTADLMRDITSEKIIPVVRNNADAALPTFLSTKLYIDFGEDALFEGKYTELLHDIHGEPIRPRPPLGRNPFNKQPTFFSPEVSFSPARYVNAANQGEAEFDYSNNNGHFVFGAGDMAFETAWSRGGGSSIYGYSDPPSITKVAWAGVLQNFSDIKDAELYDGTSRARDCKVGETLIWQNTSGYYLATKVVSLTARGYNGDSDLVKISFKIAPMKSEDFS